MTVFDWHVVLRTLILPPASPLLFGTLGLLIWRRRPRIGAAVCGTGIASLWLLCTPLVADAIARRAEGYPALDPTQLNGAQASARAIVVVGGGVRLDAPEAGRDAPAPHTALRLVETAKIARATHLPILVSGSGREAVAMRRFLEEDMLLPVRWVESESRNTRENALFSARLLRQQGIGRIILVTSSPHMVRAAAEFNAAGLQVAAAPAEMWTWDERGALALIPSVRALDRSYAALYEWAGRIMR